MQYGNSPVENMQYLQQMEAQQQPPAPRNAIAEGAKTGIEAAKRSLEMSEREERRALGMALLSFNSQPLQYGDEHRSPLTGINQGFLPAIQAYNQERTNAMGLNYQLMKDQQEAQRHQEDMAMKQQMQQAMLNERRQHHQEALEERRRHHEMQYGRVDEQIMEGGRIPLNSLPKQERTAYTKDLLERNNRGKGAYDVMKTAVELKKELDANPTLAASYKTLLLADNPEDPSIWDIIKQQKLSHRDLVSLQKIKKLQARLITQQVQGISGRVATDTMKKYIALTKPGAPLTMEANDQMINEIMSDFEPIYKDSKIAHQAIKGRYYVPYEVADFVENPEQISSPEILDSSGNEAVQAIRSQYPGTEKFSDEQIVQWAQSRGLL